MERPERKTYAGSQCPSCGSEQVIRLSMTVSDAPVSFAACNVCEWKRWEREGQSVPLGSMLALIGTR